MSKEISPGVFVQEKPFNKDETKAPTEPAPDTWIEATKRLERNQRHWQAFLAALTGLSFHEGILVDIVANALFIADEADRQYRPPADMYVGIDPAHGDDISVDVKYRAPEEQGNG